MSITPKLPEGEAKCTVCGRVASPVVYQGAELEAICLDCLEKVDPGRAAVLRKIKTAGKPSGSPAPSQ